MIKITMVLARGPSFPGGNLDDRLELLVILTTQGLLDIAAWENGQAQWLTSRDRPGHPRRTGELVKLESGWAIRGLEHEDGPLLGFTATIVRPGEITSVTRLDGEDLIYRIVAVEPE
jgi:hypothetical protein